MANKECDFFLCKQWISRSKFNLKLKFKDTPKRKILSKLEGNIQILDKNDQRASDPIKGRIPEDIEDWDGGIIIKILLLIGAAVTMRSHRHLAETKI